MARKIFQSWAKLRQMPGRKPRTNGTAPLVRAAIAYADAKDPDVAEHMNISLSTLGRWKGSGSTTTPSTEQLQRLADYCGVPQLFLRDGFAGMGEHPAGRRELDDRLDWLAAEVRTAKAERADLEQRLVDLYGELESRLLKRVDEALERGRRRPPGDSRSTGGGRRTP